MNTLHLIIKKKWFDMILSGEKTEEYRDIKPYYNLRLIGREYDTASFAMVMLVMLQASP